MGKEKLALAFLAGLLLGSLSAFVFTHYQENKLQAYFYRVLIAEFARDAREVRSGDGELMLGRKEESLRQMAELFAQKLSSYVSESQRLDTLWQARRYYDENPKWGISPELKGVLDSLPPHPAGCCGAGGACGHQPGCAHESE